MVGMNIKTGHFVHGDARIVYSLGPNALYIAFKNIKGLNDGGNVSNLNFLHQSDGQRIRIS